MNLNLNFYQQTGRRKPTQNEINQIADLSLGVKAIIKTLRVYATEYDSTEIPAGEVSGVCISVCNALDLLMEPITEYMTNYAGDEALPEYTEIKQVVEV